MPRVLHLPERDVSGPLIIIPKPIPPGRRAEYLEKTHFPTCDRCQREGSERNPVILGNARPSMLQSEKARGVTRRDAVCVECRDLLKRRH